LVVSDVGVRLELLDVSGGIGLLVGIAIQVAVEVVFAALEEIDPSIKL
jgi:hypothetical protein